MSQVPARHAARARVRRFSILAALAIALLGVAGSGLPAAADAYYCAVGGKPTDGGAAGVACVFGGDAGAAVAGSVDVSDPGVTLAAGFGGDDGYPAVNVAGYIGLAEPSVHLAGGSGGNNGYPAYSGVISYA